MKLILILASNPRSDLNLDYEIHALKSIIDEQQDFRVIIDEAISPSNIQSLLLQHKPRIVHFCGHGSGINGLVFINATGQEQLVSTQALSSLFQEFENTLECVLLNACYSKVQANAIAQHINYAIGMNQAINDDMAILFAKGFYQALGSGKKIEQCFRLGKNAIELELSKLSGQPRKFKVLNNEEDTPIAEYLQPTIAVKSKLTVFPEVIVRQKRQTSFGRKENKYRQILLNRVEQNWIKEVLETSLHTKVLLELEIQGRPDLVHNPFREYQEFPVDSNSSYDWLHAADVFEQMGDGRTLLILGKPGSGKTITLLKLAERFVGKAKQDLSLPIPVIFNLSSWGAKRKPLSEWLIIELKEKYQVRKARAKQWIEQEQLLLLLDGLDEVKPEYRKNCLKAINNFLDAHEITEIVVCSRFQEYKLIFQELQLRNAIYIQPLTSEHIDWYLRDTGEELAGLKTLLKNDAVIEDFAKTPLILSIMSLTYQNYSSEEIWRQLQSSNNRYKNLFGSYVERMFQRKPNIQRYKKQLTLKWLTWLATKMKAESKTIFLIEHLQPKYLENNAIIYKIINLITIKFIFILPCVVIIGFYAKFNFLLIFDVLKYVGRILLVGLFFIGLQIYLELDQPIPIVGQLTISLDNYYYKILAGLSGGAVIGAIFSYLGFDGLVYGTCGGLIYILGTLITTKDINETTSPNQGIWNSLKNSLIIFLSVGLTFGIVIGNIIDASNGVTFGVILGILVAIRYSGFTAIRHFILRIMLFSSNLIPWNYNSFLDYSTDIILMQKVIRN